MSATYETFMGLRERLAEAAFPPGLPWWNTQAERFYRSGAKRFAARVGRGGAKSTNMVDFAINETVFGDWTIPIGEVHFFAFVSQNKSEAAQRLRQIAARLRALKIPFDQSGDEIVLRDMPRGFRVFACQVGAVSGFRCFGFCADEASKWSNADHSANPAAEVVASIRAMTITHKQAREYYVSSPLGILDLHYEIIQQGDSADQVVAIAPTWIANDTITEAETRSKEPDERIWRREYKAEPQASASNAFDPDAVARAFRPMQTGRLFERVGLVDLSSGRGDALAYGVASWGMPCVAHIPEYLTEPAPRHAHTVIDGKDVVLEDWSNTFEVPRLDDHGQPIPNPERERHLRPHCIVHMVDAVTGRFSGKVTSSDAVRRIARVFQQYGVHHVIGDHYEQFFAASEFKRHGLRYHPVPWTSQSKFEAITRLKRLFAEDLIVLPERETLRKELLSYAEKVSATGNVTWSARGAGHDDEVSLLISLAHGEMENLVPGAPSHIPRRRHEQALRGGAENMY